jgi:hypothetical protein
MQIEQTLALLTSRRSVSDEDTLPRSQWHAGNGRRATDVPAGDERRRRPRLSILFNSPSHFTFEVAALVGPLYVKSQSSKEQCVTRFTSYGNLNQHLPKKYLPLGR